MTLETSLDLVQDILDRADELTDGSSDFQTQALRFLNRAYRALCMGGNEFMPGRNPDWWWLRTTGSLYLRPAYTTGTMSVTAESIGVAISTPPSGYSLQGWHIKFASNEDVYYMRSHVSGEFAGSLDSPYTGATQAGVSFTAMPLEYELATDVLRLLDPMKTDRDGENRISGMSIDILEEQFPLGDTQEAVPSRFAPVSESRVRFNAYPSEALKVRYPYIRRAPDLEYLDTSVPLVPLQFRYILADMALYYLMEQKEDTRKDAVAQLAQSGIKAMDAENRSRMNRIGEVGQIFTRPRQRNTRILRTESGHIIG